MLGMVESALAVDQEREVRRLNMAKKKDEYRPEINVYMAGDFNTYHVMTDPIIPENCMDGQLIAVYRLDRVLKIVKTAEMVPVKRPKRRN